MPNPFKSQDLNRFAYVRSNPVRYTDPTGHMLPCEPGDVCRHPDPTPSPQPGPQPEPDPDPMPDPNPIPSPAPTPAPQGVNNYDCFTYPYSCGIGMPSPITEISTSNHPNWYHIAAGVGLAIVALAADALIIYTLPALIEVYEATVIVDAVAIGMPLTSGLIYIHVEAITLIKDGINGK